MMRTRLSLALGLSLAATACAVVGQNRAPDPAERMRHGLDALADGDIARAHEHLDWVYRNHAGQRIGQEALLALVALELDPRNPGRRLWASADLAGELMSNPAAPDWLRPVGGALYHVALELGATEERRARGENARTALEYEGAAVLQQLDSLRTQRDDLRRRNELMQQTITQLERELRDKDAELERIRRTIRG